MSDILIALLATLGAGTWIYSKIYRSTGGNTKSSLIFAAASGLVIFLAVTTLLKAIFG